MERIHVRLTDTEDVNMTMGDGEVERLDELVEDSELFTSRSDAVRYAVRALLQREEINDVR